MKSLPPVSTIVCLTLAAVCVTQFASTARAQGPNVPKVLEFQTMVPIPVGQLTLRGIRGAGQPWALTAAAGELKADGVIEIAVEGLVRTQGPMAGTSTPTFRAIVSCISLDASGQPVVVQVETDEFPTDGFGNCLIEDQVDLPDPCIAPIVFVTNVGGTWFAVTGF